jgi:predicted PurR-regulated permease PerM
MKELAAAKAALESASKSSPTSSNSSGSNTVVYVGTPLASAINPVTENLPKGIEDVAKTGAGFIDSFSSNTAARLGASKASLKNTLDAAARLSVAEEKLAQTSGSATSTKASGFGALTKYLKDQMAATGGLKEPWTYAKYLGITMLLYLVSRPIVLAIILTLVLLYIIWKIIRHFRRHRLD